MILWNVGRVTHEGQIMRLLIVGISFAGLAFLALSADAQSSKSKSPGEESLKDKKAPTKDKKKKFLMPLPVFRDGKLAGKSLNEWLKDIPTKGEAFPDTGRVETAIQAIQVW